jgi:hypothetical protein
MARVRQEITVWDKAPNTPNHTYITEGTTLIGVIPKGETVAKYFSRPLRTWSTSRRKFRDLTKAELSVLSL